MEDQTLSQRVRALEALVTALLAFRRDKDVNDIADAAVSIRRTMMSRDWRTDDESLVAQAIELLSETNIIHRDNELQGIADAMRWRQSDFEHALALYLITQSFGLPSQDLPLPRFVPCRVFIDLEDVQRAAQIRDAVEGVARASGLDYFGASSLERGSWFYRWLSKSRETLSQPEVMDRLAKMERALELVALQKPQAEIDEKQLTAASKLIEALKTTPNAACQVGSILVVKVTDAQHGERLVVRTLTQRQMVAVERDEYILRNPVNLLKLLDSLEHGEEGQRAPLP